MTYKTTPKVDVVFTVPPHVSLPSEREKVPAINKMTLDFGAISKKEAEEMGVLAECICTPYNKRARGFPAQDLISVCMLGVL